MTCPYRNRPDFENTLLHRVIRRFLYCTQVSCRVRQNLLSFWYLNETSVIYISLNVHSSCFVINTNTPWYKMNVPAYLGVRSLITAGIVPGFWKWIQQKNYILTYNAQDRIRSRRRTRSSISLQDQISLKLSVLKSSSEIYCYVLSNFYEIFIYLYKCFKFTTSVLRKDGIRHKCLSRPYQLM